MNNDSENILLTQAPKFAFCVHSHQPAGNSPEIMEKVYRASYLPFFSEISEHPQVKLNAHFSGYLLEWMIEEHPEYIDKIKAMVKRGQVEILGGGIYEPILPSIPARDAVGQILEMNELIRKTFGTTPRGMWLAERVWEPNLPSILCEAGMEYTLVDDLGFLNAGLSRESLAGYYTTEYDAREVHIYPINIRIRNSIPFSGHLKALNLIEKTSLNNSGRLAVFGDDCEKFGSWPGTAEDVYKKRWLRKFLNGIVKGRIETWKLSDYSRASSSGMVYLPTCSYPEMMKWALGPGEQKRAETLSSKRGMERGQIILGASWRNFLLKYHESMRLYRKIRHVSDLVQGAGSDHKAVMNLYRGEANDVLWHGVFGGIYLPLLRSKSYSSLIGAQNIAEEKNGKLVYSEKLENDLAGKSSFAISTDYMWAHADTNSGLVLEELDLRGRELNLTDTLTRREEAYHLSIERLLKTAARKKGNIGKGLYVKNIGDIKNIVYDRSPRVTFRDHIISGAGDISNHLLSHDEIQRHNGKADILEEHDAIGVSMDYTFSSGSLLARLIKTVMLSKRGPEVKVSYSFREVSGRAEYMIGSEINLSAYASRFDQIRVNGSKISSMALIQVGTSTLNIDYLSERLSIIIHGDNILSYHVYPIETISNSEEGLEAILQGICIIASGRVSEDGFSLSIKAVETGKGERSV